MTDASYLFPSPEPSAGGGGGGGVAESLFFFSAAANEAGSSSSSSGGEHESEGHEITDFGIGTLVLAMTLGAASRTYLTHVTG